MSLLKNKKILVTGLLSNRSIAYGIAKIAQLNEAELAFTYVEEKFRDRIRKLASEFKSDIVLECDVSSDKSINKTFLSLREHWESFDGLVHSIAFAPRDSLNGDFLENTDRSSFKIAHDISSYSLTALTKNALPYLNRGSSIVTLSYQGSNRTFPNYNVMGLAKASLEANVRYLCESCGKKNIRVNAISAGPIKTLAAAGISNFNKLLKINEKIAPLRRNVTLEEIGNAVVFYLSNMSSGITGEITFVDGGFNTKGVTFNED